MEPSQIDSNFNEKYPGWYIRKPFRSLIDEPPSKKMHRMLSSHHLHQNFRKHIEALGRRWIRRSIPWSNKYFLWVMLITCANRFVKYTYTVYTYAVNSHMQTYKKHQKTYGCKLRPPLPNLIHKQTCYKLLIKTSHGLSFCAVTMKISCYIGMMSWGHLFNQYIQPMEILKTLAKRRMIHKQIPGVSEFLDPTPGDNTTWRLSDHSLQPRSLVCSVEGLADLRRVAKPWRHAPLSGSLKAGPSTVWWWYYDDDSSLSMIFKKKLSLKTILGDCRMFPEKISATASPGLFHICSEVATSSCMSPRDCGGTSVLGDIIRRRMQHVWDVATIHTFKLPECVAGYIEPIVRGPMVVQEHL